VAERVVDALEMVEVADHQRERGAALPQAVLEAAAVAQPGQRVELGQLAQALEVAGGLDRADRVVGERAQRAQPVDAGEQQVDRVVGPQEAEQRAVAVAQRHHQPVVVPGARATAVVVRRVDGRDAERGRHRVRGRAVEQHAALLLVLGRHHRVDRRGGERPDAVEVVEADAGGQDELPVARLEEHGGLLEPERVADALTDGREHLRARAARRQLGRHAQQVLDRGAVAGGLGGELAVLDHAGGDRRDGGHDLERTVGGAAAVDRVVEREEGERAPVGRGQRHEQRVVGVPGVRPDGPGGARHPGNAGAGEVELVVRYQVGVVAAEALVEQPGELLGVDVLAHQRLARLGVVALDHHDLVVVPGRAVDVHNHGQEAERLGDRGRDLVEQALEIVARADDRGHVQQCAQARERAGLSDRSDLGCRHLGTFIGGESRFL
jgi:hypothetical protein